MIVQAGHTEEQIDKAIRLFIEAAQEIGYFEYMKNFRKYGSPLQKEITKYSLKIWLKSWFVPVDFTGLTPS